MSQISVLLHRDINDLRTGGGGGGADVNDPLFKFNLLYLKVCTMRFLPVRQVQV